MDPVPYCQSRKNRQIPWVEWLWNEWHPINLVDWVVVLSIYEHESIGTIPEDKEGPYCVLGCAMFPLPKWPEWPYHLVDTP